MIGDLEIDLDTFDTFEEIVGYSVMDIMEEFGDFISSSYKDIVQSYSKGGTEIPSASVRKYLEVKESIRRLISDINLNKDALSVHAGFWDIYEAADEMKSIVDTVDNLRKWTRSSTGSRIIGSINLKQDETIEEAMSRLGILESEWYNIAIDNDLFETDYTPDSASRINISSTEGLSGVIVDDVVDEMIGLSVYGKDINVKISFKDDDIATVSGKDCRDQMIDNAIKSGRGSVPEDDSYGCEYPASPKTSFPISSVYRQIASTVLNDSVIKSVNINDVKYNKDGIVISLYIEDKVSSDPVIKNIII